MYLCIWIMMSLAGIQYTVHGVRGDSDRYWQSKNFNWRLGHQRLVNLRINPNTGHQQYNVLNVSVDCGDGRILDIYKNKKICGLSFVDYTLNQETLKFHFTERNHSIPSGDCSGKEFVESKSIAQVCAVTSSAATEEPVINHDAGTAGQ